MVSPLVYMVVVTAGVAATSLWGVDELRSATGSSLSLLTPPYTLPVLQERRIFGLRALWGFAAVTSVRRVMTVTPPTTTPLYCIWLRSLYSYATNSPLEAHQTRLLILYSLLYCIEPYTHVYMHKCMMWSILRGEGGSNLPTITKAGYFNYFFMKTCSFCHTYLHSIGKSYAFFPYSVVLHCSHHRYTFCITLQKWMRASCHDYFCPL